MVDDCCRLESGLQLPQSKDVNAGSLRDQDLQHGSVLRHQNQEDDRSISATELADDNINVEGPLEKDTVGSHGCLEVLTVPPHLLHLLPTTALPQLLPTESGTYHLLILERSISSPLQNPPAPPAPRKRKTQPSVRSPPAAPVTPQQRPADLMARPVPPRPAQSAVDPILVDIFSPLTNRLCPQSPPHGSLSREMSEPVPGGGWQRPSAEDLQSLKRRLFTEEDFTQAGGGRDQGVPPHKDSRAPTALYQGSAVNFAGIQLPGLPLPEYSSLCSQALMGRVISSPQPKGPSTPQLCTQPLKQRVILTGTPLRGPHVSRNRPLLGALESADAGMLHMESSNSEVPLQVPGVPLSLTRTLPVQPTGLFIPSLSVESQGVPTSGQEQRQGSGVTWASVGQEQRQGSGITWASAGSRPSPGILEWCPYTISAAPGSNNVSEALAPLEQSTSGGQPPSLTGMAVPQPVSFPGGTTARVLPEDEGTLGLAPDAPSRGNPGDSPFTRDPKGNSICIIPAQYFSTAGPVGLLLPRPSVLPATSAWAHSPASATCLPSISSTTALGNTQGESNAFSQTMGMSWEVLGGNGTATASWLAVHTLVNPLGNALDLAGPSSASYEPLSAPRGLELVRGEAWALPDPSLPEGLCSSKVAPPRGSHLGHGAISTPSPRNVLTLVMGPLGFTKRSSENEISQKSARAALGPSSLTDIPSQSTPHQAAARALNGAMKSQGKATDSSALFPVRQAPAPLKTAVDQLVPIIMECMECTPEAPSVSFNDMAVHHMEDPLARPSQGASLTERCHLKAMPNQSPSTTQADKIPCTVSVSDNPTAAIEGSPTAQCPGSFTAGQLQDPALAAGSSSPAVAVPSGQHFIYSPVGRHQYLSMSEEGREKLCFLMLLPCRSAMQGAFPLNGTFFQVNEYFLDHLPPGDYPQLPNALTPDNVVASLEWCKIYFGSEVRNICADMTQSQIKHMFARCGVCVRALDRATRFPKPLPPFVTPKKANRYHKGANDVIG